MQSDLSFDNNSNLADSILSSIGDGLISTDLQGRIIYLNRTAGEIIGCTQTEGQGKEFKELFQLIHAETGEPLDSPVDYVLQHKVGTGLQNNTAFVSKNNAMKYISASCTPMLSSDGSMIGVVVVFRDITRIKTFEIIHLREEQRLQEIFKDTPAAVILLDRDARILKANDVALKYTQLSMEQLLGKHIGECIDCRDCDDYTQCGSPEGVCNYCKLGTAVTNAIRNGTATRNFEINAILYRDFREINLWFNVNVTPIQNAPDSKAVITLFDISTSKKKEIQARESSEYCNNILSQLPFTVFMTDENFNWKYVNRANAEITGVPYLDTTLEHWFSLAHPEDADTFRKSAMKALMRKTLFVKEVRFPRADGVYRWCMIIGSPFYDQEGQFTGYIGCSYDISLQKEAEEDLKHTQEMLIAAKEAAEAANRAKSEFLANMSHEIRTPINGMVGMIDLTLLSLLDEDQRDNLITAKACAASLTKIVNDILDFSKMEANKLTLEYVDFNLKDLLDEIIRLHSPRVTGKGLELYYRLDEELPPYLIGDPNRLRQILNNLISNAIKFTEKGQITITIECLFRTRDEVELKFAVSDTGIGIAKEDLKLLFHSFSQIENTYTKKYGGTGLGLVISKQLVEMMGGSIEAESQRGQGSTFRFTVKFKVGKEVQTAVNRVEESPKTAKSLHILLAEDDLINQKVALKILHEKGHIVDVAGNGCEALEHYSHMEYDVILMDIQMPKMNGLEAAQRIQQLEQGGKHTPIVAMTAYALPGDREKFLKLGMDAYISKPIQMNELFYILEEITSTEKYNTPESVTITEDGEVIFSFGKPVCFNSESTQDLEDMESKIKRLSDRTDREDFRKIELLASEIKRLAINMDAIDIKDTAFKIELAARRGNAKEAEEYIEQIKYEFKLYHTSN